MDVNTLAAAMGNVPGVDYASLLPGYLKAMRAANITNVNRAAMFAAQLGHESVGLRYMEEIADGSAYEGRADLGNTQPGDGRRFKGRGPIQLTGRNNHRAFTRWANSNGISDRNFEAEPHLLSDPEFGFLAASYYWTVARPDINALADRGDLEGVTRRINGGTNGLADRARRYRMCLSLGSKLLPGEITGKKVKMVEKVLPYSRVEVRQNTPYYCGPASTQTIVLSKTGILQDEDVLAGKLGTTVNGTDYIGQFPRVLNSYLTGAKYVHRDMPNDPPTAAQRNQLWNDVLNSIDGGYGVVANIVAPPSNYPRAVAPSDIQPAYSGGTVYHYVAIMGYGEDEDGRRYWVADSGFYPYGYWISEAQMSSLIPPKGYAYATAKPPAQTTTVFGTELTKEQRMDLEKYLKSIDNKVSLVLDQMVGPEKDSKGQKFTGWDAKDLREVIARKEKNGENLTMTEQVFKTYDATNRSK